MGFSTKEKKKKSKLLRVQLRINDRLGCRNRCHSVELSATLLSSGLAAFKPAMKDSFPLCWHTPSLAYPNGPSRKRAKTDYPTWNLIFGWVKYLKIHRYIKDLLLHNRPQVTKHFTTKYMQWSTWVLRDKYIQITPCIPGKKKLNLFSIFLYK